MDIFVLNAKWYQHEIILVSDIYTSILLVDIYNLDIYFLKIFEHAKIVHG